MPKIISILNMKGGVAKTTSTQNIGSYLNKVGKKSLLIDWDPQGDLSYSVLDEEEIIKNTKDLVKGEEIGSCITKAGEFDIIATVSEEALVSAIESIKLEDRHYILSDALDNLIDYDYVLIDCPPTEGSVPLNALIASDYVFIPVVPEDLPVRKMESTIKLINKLQKRGSNIQVGGIFATKVDARLSIHNDNLEYLKQEYGDVLLKSKIPLNIKLSEASRLKKSIFAYSGSSKGAKAYEKLSQEILEVLK